MKKYLKYLLFVFILIINLDVFAADYNYTNKIYYSPDSAPGTYSADEILLGGTSGPYAFGTTYQGCISEMTFYLYNLDTIIDTNTKYKVTLNMANNDWRNKFMGPNVFRANDDGSVPSAATNMFVLNSFTFVSYKKIYFYIQTPSVLGPYIKFTIYSHNYNNTCMTGDTNWTFQSVIISTITSSTSTPLPVYTPTPSAPTPTPNNTQQIIDGANQNTQDVINNNNQNTQNIIENDNQNTQDVINNNNQNTQDIIDNNNSNTTCPTGPYRITKDQWTDKDGKYLSSDGTEVSNSAFAITPYLIIKPNTKYKINVNGGSMSGTTYYCLYTSNKSLRSCSPLKTIGSVGEIEFTTDNYVGYMRLTLSSSRIITLTGPVCNDWEKEGFNNIKNSIDSLNDTMKDDNVDDKTGFFTDFNNNNHGLTSIITAPLSTIQQLTDTSCVELSVPIPFTNGSVSLPCMKNVYQTYIPNVYNIWKIVSFGIISYFICLDIFKIVKGFKDPNEDKVEVLDL